MRASSRLPSIDQVLVRLIFIRLYLPLLGVGFITLAIVAHIGISHLKSHQNQITDTLAQEVVHHIEQGEHILDALALAVEDLDLEKAKVFIKSTWKTYGYFETIYFLDAQERVMLLMPDDDRYAGIDLSSLPAIRNRNNPVESARPYISIRTGEPTVLLIRSLKQGGQMVGELNLGLFQKKVLSILKKSGKDFVFIADQNGTLLAHPHQELVRQQFNISNLGIFSSHRYDTIRLYNHDGIRVIGSATKIEKNSWLVIAQEPLSTFARSYIAVLPQVVPLSIIIWATLWWVLRNQLRQRVVMPLNALSRQTTKLASGHFDRTDQISLFNQMDTSSKTSPTFYELDSLSQNFDIMSRSLCERNEELRKINEDLELKVEERTIELSTLNNELQNEINVRARAEEELAKNKQEIEAAYIKLKEVQRLEAELHQSQKLESVGRLAAGIAHEINTPIQYISDNIHFLGEILPAIQQFILKHQEILIQEQKEAVDLMKNELEIDFIMEQIPLAVEHSLYGVERVATIVRAMKEFAHPDLQEMTATNLNRSLEATVEIARNEYKYVADVEVDLGEIPPVVCHAGEINQVFLNILVNAAHAIGDVVKGTDQRGKIHIQTRRDGDYVVVSISDTGTGIPLEVHDKIFEPFFTTKEVGRGSGQGLSLSQAIVSKHRGIIDFKTTPGIGTTFIISIPICE